MCSRLAPFLFLAGLGLLYFGALLVHPTYVLYSDHSDLLATFLPVKHFLVRSWQQTGEVPLWCPYSFGGMPFIHDVQVAAFYPLHWPLYLLAEDWLGAAMSWLVVGHVIIAGWCMYAYGQSQGLDRTAALLAGVGYMFAGKWLLHILEAGHYVLIPLAWLPLVLLWLEQAIRERSFRRATWAGSVFALIVLGTHPQMTFFAGLFIALWTMGSIKDRESVTRWLTLGACTAVTAATLSAVQLLPALEAAPESTRAAGVPASDAAAVALPALLGLMGPAWNGGWEDRGCLGLLWVAAALAAPLLFRGRVRFQAWACLMLVCFSAGGAAFLQWLPGFRLFQLPVRMLMLLALPVALLAGQTTQALLADTQARSICRRALFRVLGAGLLLAGCDWLLHPTHRVPAYWGALLVTATVAAWLLDDRCRLSRRAWASAWFAVLLADSWALTWSKVAVQSVAELYAPSACVQELVQAKQLAPREHWRVLDRGLAGQPSSAPLGAALPMFADVEIEPVLGYNPFDLRRYKEFLQFVTNEDRPVRPREGIFGYPIVQGFPIRNKSLLDLLGTRYLLHARDGTTSFDAEGEPDRNQRWQKVGEVDPHPAVYSFLAGGVQQLPPYQLYENLDALPRAFVVHWCVPLADRPRVLAQLKSTDFRYEVLLEGDCLAAGRRPARVFDPPLNSLDSATIREVLPNHVVVEVRAEDDGYLVLTDIWFPGWNCTVDGQRAPIHRANFLFRAVAIPAGIHEVVFRFEPASYRWGKRVSIMSLIAVTAFSLLSRCRRKLAISQN